MKTASLSYSVISGGFLLPSESTKCEREDLYQAILLETDFHATALPSPRMTPE